MRIRATVWKDNHLLKDHTICDQTKDTRTHKVFRALDEACSVFDLPHPQWLDSVVREFQRHSRCRFRQDCFVGEEIEGDYLELQVLEED